MLDQKTILEGLTEPQRQAVQHVDGPLLIVAGAGSGKTRVITRRVAYLASLGLAPHQILAITFTNKAAGEMKSRVSETMDRPLRDFGRLDQPWPTICTFHSLCLRILRHYGPVIGLPDSFTIYDSADQTKVIKEALKLLEISSTNFTPGQLHATISEAKNRLITPEQYTAAATDFYARTCARVYAKYQQLLAANNAVDFDDLLMKVVLAFRDHPQMLAELQQRFQYILIDEYQDTNHAQYMLAHGLALRHRNICVVGDPDQSIYAWRGADIRNILDFEKDYPDATVVKLERNYRSTKRILSIASTLIARNTQRKEKRLWTENSTGEKATVALCQDEHDEARFITEQLREQHEKHGRPWNDMAVFYRVNALSRVMEDALRRAAVPYQIARGVEFYNRREIKDVLAYLRVVANPADEVNLLRIINTPTRGIGGSSLRLMQAHALSVGQSLWQSMQQCEQIDGLSARAVKATQGFVQLVASWRRLAGLGDAAPARPARTAGDAEEDGQRLFAGGEAAERPRVTHHRTVREVMEDVVRRSGLEALYRKEDRDHEEGERPTDNIAELISSAAEFDAEHEGGTLSDYLSLVSLVSDADHMQGAGGAVTLMTLHAAKGLEFPVVAIIGLEEGLLPHARAQDDPMALEEERRLCFVGITRAEEKLYLSKAASRTVRGLRMRTISSPFLGELPPDDLEVVDRTELTSIPEGFGAADRWRGQSRGRFYRGQRVRHPQFGLGEIADISDMGPQTRAVVEFSRAGRKTLILEYARLEPAD